MLSVDEVESLWGQQSESLNPVAFLGPSKIRILPVYLFNYKNR